jgi:hypothetical protein
VGIDGEHGPPADRHEHADLAGQVSVPVHYETILALITGWETAATGRADLLRTQIAALSSELAAIDRRPRSSRLTLRLATASGLPSAGCLVGVLMPWPAPS